MGEYGEDFPQNTENRQHDVSNEQPVPPAGQFEQAPLTEDTSETSAADAAAPRAEDTGRFDIDKARTIGFAINKSGTDNYSEDEQRKLSQYGIIKPALEAERLEKGMDKLSSDFQEAARSWQESDNEKSQEQKNSLVAQYLAKSEHPEDARSGKDLTNRYETRMDDLADGFEKIQNQRMDRIKSKQNTFEACYSLNPDRFKDMPTSEFMQAAGEYTFLVDSLESNNLAIASHDYFIDEMNGALRREDASVLEMDNRARIDKPGTHSGELLRGHYSTEIGRRGSSGATVRELGNSLGGLVEFTENVIYSSPARRTNLLKSVVAMRQKGNVEFADVCEKILNLGNSFIVPPKERIEGYRDLVASYWKPSAETARDATAAKLEAFKKQYSPESPESTEQTAE